MLAEQRRRFDGSRDTIETHRQYLGLRLALALGAMVSGVLLATRFQHKRMAAGLEHPPITATEGRA